MITGGGQVRVEIIGCSFRSIKWIYSIGIKCFKVKIMIYQIFLSLGVPHPNGSHCIISDDLKLLEEKLERRIPTGYIIINGRAQATQKFCEAVQRGKPVFVFMVQEQTDVSKYKYLQWYLFNNLFIDNLIYSFQHTGNAADLICDTLRLAKDFVIRRSVNPRAKPDKPFSVNLVESYV